jgi:hypothetical protein
MAESWNRVRFGSTIGPRVRPAHFTRFLHPTSEKATSSRDFENISSPLKSSGQVLLKALTVSRITQNQSG